MALGAYVQLVRNRGTVGQSSVEWRLLWSTRCGWTLVVMGVIYFCALQILRATGSFSGREAAIRVAHWLHPLLLFALVPWAELRFLNRIDDIVLGAVLLLVLWRVGMDLGRLPGVHHWIEGLGAQEQSRKLAVAVALCVSILPVLYTLEVFETRRHPVGDEPSYLTITHSLVFDHDIIMENNYIEGDYRRFYSGPYPMFTHLGKDGHNYPHHSIGLPLFLTPVYYLGSLGSDRFLVMTLRLYMAMLFAILSHQVFMLSRRIAGNAWHAALAVLVASLSTPLLFYSTEIYPELPAALLLVIAIRILIAGHWTVRHNLGMGVLLGILPWLGIKYIPLAAVMAMLWLLILLRRPRRLAGSMLLAIPLLLLLGLYLAFLRQLYGNFSPVSIYTGVEHSAPASLQAASVPDLIADFSRNLGERLAYIRDLWLGVLLEQRMGLFILAPVFLYALWGMCCLFFNHPTRFMVLAVPCAAHITLYGYQANWGGFCPPNRPIITVLPLLIPFMAYGFSRLRSRKHAILFPLAFGMSLVISGTFLYHHRWLYQTMNPHLEGGYALFLHNLSMPFGPYLPDLFPLIMGGIKHQHSNFIFTIILVSAATLMTAIAFTRRGEMESIAPPVVILGGGRMRSTVVCFWFAALLLYRWWSLPGDRYRFDYPGGACAYGLYNQDGTIYAGELDGMWLHGGRKARLLIETTVPVTRFTLTGHSLVDNRLFVGTIGSTQRLDLKAQIPFKTELGVERTMPRGNFRYHNVELSCSFGLQPSAHFDSSDDRLLGCFMKLDCAR
ncbi:hypothetical protein JW905_00390 [bacterium]|nr:hypothetical protein [candidate division CSSED10-310 bacterium]